MMRYPERPKWYLMQWKAIVKHHDELPDTMQETARILFGALKEMPKEDVSLLYEKYYETDKGTNYHSMIGDFSKYTPESDKRIAERKNIPQISYTKARVKAEEHFSVIIHRLIEKLNILEIERLESYVLRLGSLYLKDYHKLEGNRLNSDNIIFTMNKAQAKRFRNGASEGDYLIHCLQLEKASPATEWENTSRHMYFDY